MDSILLVTSDESASRDAWVHQLCANPTAELQGAKALVYSPTLFTGIDIPAQGMFDEVWLCGLYETLTAEDLVQAVHRVRRPNKRDIHAFVRKPPGYFPTDGKRAQEQVRDTFAWYHNLRYRSAGGRERWREGCAHFGTYVIDSQRLENLSRGSRPERFRAALRAMQYNVQEVPATHGYWQRDAHQWDTAKGKAFAELVVATPRPSRRVVAELERKENHTQEEAAALARVGFERLAGEDTTRVRELTERFGKPDNLRRVLDTLQLLQRPEQPGQESRRMELIRRLEATYSGVLARDTIVSPEPFNRVCRANATDIEAELGFQVADRGGRPFTNLKRYVERVFRLSMENGPRIRRHGKQVTTKRIVGNVLLSDCLARLPNTR